MSESLRKKLVFVGFIGALIWGYFNFHDSAPKSTTADIVSAGNEQTTGIVVNNPVKPINVEAKLKEPWGTDPFHPVVVATSKGSQPAHSLYWQLSGIIYTNQSPVAIINQKPVGVGQVVDNAKVIAIDKNEVTLEANGVRMTLTVSQG